MDYVCMSQLIIRHLAYIMDTSILSVILWIYGATSLSAVPQECFFESVQYKGHARTSSNNRPCRLWSDVLTASEPLAFLLPDKTLNDASNFCRDPDGKGHPWCYVWLTSSRAGWEYCDVSYCQECFYPSATRNYSGHTTATSGNSTCQRWQDVHAPSSVFNDSQFTDGSVVYAYNYCRDPLGLGYLYCPANGSLTKCDIPQCMGQCKDYASFDCADLDATAGLCGDDYFSTIMCAQTCGKCGFGLMPPIEIDPPIDTCVDDADTDCWFLQGIICPDPHTARELCPKTCNMCVDTRPSISTTTAYITTISTPGYSSKVSSTNTPSLTTQVPNGDCFDSPDVNCGATSIKHIVCQHDVYARQFCRKTCGKCDSAALAVKTDNCTDPMAVSNMCPLLNEELCICDDMDLRPKLCPHYCGGECGPVVFGPHCQRPAIVG